MGGSEITNIENASTAISTELVDLVGRARDYAAGAKAESTRRAYAGDWRDFECWCVEHDVEPLPATPSVVGVYLADQAQTLKPARTN